jgi:MATE family multidrug resistance protein
MANDKQATSYGQWWVRPCGGRDVLRLAMPLVLSSLSWTILTFIDRMFLMWWSQDSLAASFPAALLWWTSLCFPLGMCMYASTFVSQYFGAGQHHKIGPAVWQAVWVGVMATPVILLLVMPLAGPIFRAAGHSAAVRAQEIQYFHILCAGSAAMLISYAFSAFYSGQGRTSVVMVIDCFAALANIVLDYLWIFGHGGFAAYGIEGAAWATVVALWARVLVYVVLLVARRNRVEFGSMRMAINGGMMKRLISYGGPSGLQMFLEIIGFTAFVFLVGSLGDTELAATNLAFNVSSLAFMPVFGLGTAASIIVGQQLGRNDPDLAARGTWTTMCLAVAYMLLVSLLYVAVPDLFLYGFFASEGVQGAEETRAIAVVLLRYVAAYNLFDALNLVFVSAIKGAGDTRFVFAVSLAMAIVLAAGTWVGLAVFDVGLHGCWALVTVWISLLGLIYLARFLNGRWRTMRVIETDAATAMA